jgi:hypothetical protein
MFLGLLLVVYSCVDDYQDANPPLLLDAPAVSSVSAADDLLFAGESTTITIVVVDAPAGIDSVGYTIADASGKEVGTIRLDNFSEMKGKTKGDIVATYTSEDLTAAEVTITFSVFDLQYQLGDTVRKSSVPRGVDVRIVCESDIAGTYDASTTGAGNTPDGEIPGAMWDGVGVVTLTATEDVGIYTIDEITGEFYNLFWEGAKEEGTFRDECGDYSIDTKTDQYGDTLTATVTNNGDGTITIEWDNTYGDAGTTILTPQ